MERRSITAAGPVRVKTREDGKGKTIGGYGAVFYNASDPGTQYQLWQDVFERIMPGAFDRAIREDDVRSLFNHDCNIVLGRASAGTLKLSIDSRGLLYEASPADTQLLRDQVLSPIERGEVTGSSFMFVPLATAWIEEVVDGRTLYIRELRECQLWELGPVVFPAYEGTTTGVRGNFDLAELRASLEKWQRDKGTKGQRDEDGEAVAVRARAVQVAEAEAE